LIFAILTVRNVLDNGARLRKVRGMCAVPFCFQEFISQRAYDLATGHCGFPTDFDPQVRPSDPKFGDFQCNGILAYAKRQRLNPRREAEKVLAAFLAYSRDDFPCEVSIAGAGFLNFRIKLPALSEWLIAYGSERAIRENCRDLAGRVIAVDYSCPNSAKQMHVGHLRSMVIGDAIQRLLSFFGAHVIRDNHIGDWGTQFGILLMMIRENDVHLERIPAGEALELLEDLYRRGVAATNHQEGALETARAELVALQNGDPLRMEQWRKINAISYAAFQEIYDLAEVKFDHVLGESFYRHMVDRVCDELQQCEIAENDGGALVVFHRDHPQFATQPFIVRKSDGASNYATTDLATVLYRSEEWHVDEIVYVTDGRQRDHFEQLFLTVGRWFAKKNYTIPRLIHAWFGMVCGEDGRAIKTRSGESVHLKDLFREAVERAGEIVAQKNPELAAEEQLSIAQAVGIGAIKYGDLAQNRSSDYVFSWDKMLSFEGNTAPYLQYAVARIFAIFRRANVHPGEMKLEKSEGLSPSTEQEISLARKLIFYPCILRQALEDFRLHYIGTYLYELAGEFSGFYGSNRIFDGNPTEERRRLLLCATTLAVLCSGLKILGIKILKKM
jgi:arginyl-tRNA synthetase